MLGIKALNDANVVVISGQFAPHLLGVLSLGK